MVKQVIQNLLFLTFGLIIGYFVSCNGKNVKFVNKTEVITKIDTFVKEIKVDVTKIKHDVVYISKTDTLLKTLNDTLYITEFLTDSVPVNVYTGKEETNDFKLEYEVKTLGEMLSFKPTITTYQKTITEFKKIRPKWSISGAISNRGNFKVGVGYKGWISEIELNNNLNQVFVGYQYHF